jgi:hypothetical protein
MRLILKPSSIVPTILHSIFLPLITYCHHEHGFVPTRSYEHHTRVIISLFALFLNASLSCSICPVEFEALAPPFGTFQITVSGPS